MESEERARLRREERKGHGTKQTRTKGGPSKEAGYEEEN